MGWSDLRKGFGGFLASSGIPGVSGIGESMLSDEQNQWASDQAQRQMNFQKYMSNTAHQREVADLQKAGLNPILSAGGGPGASTPSGAALPGGAPTINQPDLMGYLISLKQLEQMDTKLGIEGARAAADIENKGSQTGLNKIKTVLSHKGVIRAELEQEASKIGKKVLERIKKSVRENPGQKMNNLNEGVWKAPLDITRD